MKRGSVQALRALLEPVKKRVGAHPLWATGLLLLGWFVALLMAGASEDDRTFLLNVFTAIGTVGAALVALQAVNMTREERAESAKQEDEARRPRLQIIDIREDVKPPAVNFAWITVLNLTQASMFVSEVATERHGVQVPILQDLGEVVPANESKLLRVRVNRIEGGEGALLFYFRYAVTGPAFHRIRLPTTGVTEELSADVGPRGLSFQLLIDRQTVEEHVDPPMKYRRIEIVPGRRIGNYDEV